MNTLTDPAKQALEKAHHAVNQGEMVEARHWAEKASNLAPEQEEPWLILAGVSEPPEDIYYLKRALEINPSSQAARKGMHWAVQRNRKRNSPGGGGAASNHARDLQEDNALYERWNLVVHHWWLILLIMIIAGFVGWGASYIKSEEYESNATVMIRSQRVFGAIGEEATQFNAQDAKILGEAMVSFFRSRPVAERVVETLHLDEEKPITEPIKRLRHDVKKLLGRLKNFALHGYNLEADPYEAAIESYRKNIVAAPIYQSSLLIIQSRAGDPETAAAIANLSVSTFIDYANSLYDTETGERKIYLDQQLEVARVKKEQARLDLLKFQQENHIPNLEGEINTRLGYLLQLEQELYSLDGEISSINTQLDMIRMQLESESSTQETHQESTSEFNETAKISSRSSGNSQENRSGDTETNVITTETNPLYLGLREEQLLLERTLPDLQVQRTFVKTALDLEWKYLDDLTTISSTLKQLEQDFTWASDFYNNLRMEHELVLLKMAYPIEEVRQIDVATPALYPRHPIRILYLGVGAVIGLFGGILLVILLDIWEQRKDSLLLIFRKK
jgi:uncharacterized protein involved in exopolysaccharide biosynthesis